jgi:hypothetical protein
MVSRKHDESCGLGVPALVFAEGQQGGEELRFRKAAELPGVDGAVGQRLSETAAGADAGSTSSTAASRCGG